MGSLSSVCALKYALLMSTMRTRVLDSLFGSRSWTLPPAKLVVAIDNIMRRDSSGGVGAKIASPPGRRISRAASLLRIRGLESSPLLVSTHLTEIGGLPVRRKHSLIRLMTQTAAPAP